MSNSLLNYHLSDCEPAGEGADLYEIADYYGDLLFKIRPLVSNAKIVRLNQLSKEERKKVGIKEAKEYFYVDDPKQDKKVCPFCGSKNYGGGSSWSPDGCLDCGAVHFFGMWFKDK